MTDTSSPGEVLAMLDEFATEQDGKSESALPAYSAGYRNEAKLIRAAASLIRELTELLAPMAACGKRIPEHAWDDDWYTLDGQDEDGKPFDKAEQKFLCSNLRRAAKLVEPK